MNNINILNIQLLSNDIIENIINLYIKSNYMFYYCNLSLVSKKFNYNFNNFYISAKFISFDLLNKKYNSIYYITSYKHNIKFAKMYINYINNTFYLLIGTEGTLFATQKTINYNNNKNYLKKSSFRFLKFLSY